VNRNDDPIIGPAAPAASRAWLVYACRTSYTAEVAEIVWRTGGSIALLVDNLPDVEPSPLGRVAAPAALLDVERRLPTLVPLTTPGHRYVAAAQARSLGIDSFPPLVDPTAVVARSAHLGAGTIVNALAVIGANTRLALHVQVNRSVSVGHDVTVEPYATLGPACALAAWVSVGTGAFIGAGAVLAPRVRIGDNAVVGAGAVVLDDVPARAVVVGNPAAAMKTDGAGYGGVLVPLG
jgi:sugar O-acyltransferase (sialic acid O-acetyltransferase NeuD family)